MPELLPGAVPTGILTVLMILVLRNRAAKPRLSFLNLALIGIGAAYALTPALTALSEVWRDTPGLPVITSGQLFLAAWSSLAILLIGNSPGQPPRVPLWAGALVGIAVAGLLPPFLDRVTGSYQPASLRSDVTHCLRGATGKVQPHEVLNTCDDPITVGLCLPGEVNPAPCAQSQTLAPGQTARLDPGNARLSSLPGNPNGLTIVACRPPARPSRMTSVIGRGHEGVCLPPR